MIIEHHGAMPKISQLAFVAPTAVLIGEVEIDDDASIWFGAVLRGDINKIRVGKRTSIQDNCTLHVDSNMPLTIGDDVTVGHGAILHGCTIGNSVLIGMGAIVLDGAVIGDGAIIAAGALVREGQTVNANTLVAGVPAEPKKTFESTVQVKLREHAARYVCYSKTYISS